MSRILLFAALAVAFLAGCAAKQIMPGAEKVMVVAGPPENCEYLGEVVGSQGNWWTDDTTSTRNKMVGARNELRNQAFALGATHIHLMESRNTQSRASFDVTNVTVVGNAYRCL